MKFVEKNQIHPITPYAKKNWPHKPEEFYAEAYSKFLVTSTGLKKVSMKLHLWFKAGKHKK